MVTADQDWRLMAGRRAKGRRGWEPVPASSGHWIPAAEPNPELLGGSGRLRGCWGGVGQECASATGERVLSIFMEWGAA